MQSTCDERGHCWESSTSSGWVVCRRVVDRGRGVSCRLVYCDAIAYCPGCLGYSLPTSIIAFCSVHVGFDLRAIPHVMHQKQSVESAPPPKQQSLW